ncbi:MAG: hypothetical protein R3F59_19330 [Myxococcota bacterium]
MARGWPAVAALLWACSGQGPEPQPATCDDVTWEGFAQPTITNWCLPCHASTVVGESRRGAPEGLDFDGYARAQAAADLIAGAVDGEDAPMPPGGGMRPAERDGLVRWADCGAPGPATPTPPDACSVRVDYPGDASGDTDVCGGGANALTGTLTLGGAPGPGLACLCEVDGDVVVQGATGTLSLPGLWRIGGALQVDQAQLESLALPELLEAGSVVFTDVQAAAVDLDRLTTVTGAVTLQRGSLPSVFEPLRLQSVGGVFALVAVGGVATLDLPRLESVGGDMVFQDLPALRRVLHTSDLTSVGGSLRFVGNPVLQEVEDFGFLVNVYGDVEIGGGGSLRQIDALFDLSRVSGDFVIRDEPNLVGIEGFGALRVVGGGLRVLRTGSLGIDAFDGLEELGELEIGSNSQLATWIWRAPSAIPGSVRITEVPALTALSLGGLGEVGGDFTVAADTALVDLGAPALETVGGTVSLEQNAALQSLGGLGALGSVGGDLVVRGNGALTQAEIDAWLAGWA